ncbi:MAG: hypothetical protein K2L82_00335 [Lachnospiraceae bacterium]|nr:hypothetical protein [Lachnospiraceae bacterium]
MSKNRNKDVKMDIEWQDGIKFQVRESWAAIVCGGLGIAISACIFILWLLYPSDDGGGMLLYLPLLCMPVFGIVCLVMYFQHRLTVDESNICYVNWIGKRKEFTLDEIGFCKIGGRGADNKVIVYNLLGEKLCKLEVGMCGIEEFRQYLMDNQVRVEWGKKRMNSEMALLLDALCRETAVCEEEIYKCAEKFYEEAKEIFMDWEKRNQKFNAYWEIGFAEYALEDLEAKCSFRERVSTLDAELATIPLSYQCLMEAYLKCDDGYVVNSKGEAVSIILPYMVRSKSYRIGEGTRIRKMDEQNMEQWLEMRLEGLAKELPRHRYHTETFTIQHRLSKHAGIH